MARSALAALATNTGTQLLEKVRGDHEDAQRLEHLCYGDRLRSRGVQHGEEKAAGRPHCGLPVVRELIRRRGSDFLHGLIAIGQGRMFLN